MLEIVVVVLLVPVPFWRSFVIDGLPFGELQVAMAG